jgi:hypothetical protein
MKEVYAIDAWNTRAQHAPVAWMKNDGSESWTNKKKRDAEEHCGAGGKILSMEFSIPLYAEPTASRENPEVSPCIGLNTSEGWKTENEALKQELAAEIKRRERAERALLICGYVDHGAEEWEPPIGKEPIFCLKCNDSITSHDPGVCGNCYSNLRFEFRNEEGI